MARCIASALAAVFFCAPTLAQLDDLDAAAPLDGRPQFEISLSQLDLWRITSRGRVQITPGGTPTFERGCQEIRSYADQSLFEGGAYNVQAGFSEGEWAAASFTIPAGHFPAKVDTIEMVFATQNATVQTTTRWTVGVWSGPPNTGTQVRQYSSDGLILPHIVMPVGSNGVNVLFLIDPNDPNQIVVNDNGSHVITVGYRIDEHNDQTQNPCTTAPPPRRNAFPTTDTNGLSSGANNWLNGLNCGPFGCPANGGWSTFAGLPGFCRPSGDWVIRLKYTPLDCAPGVGACCINGVCSIQTVSNCQAQGGTYQGDGTNCSNVNCPTPTQACCFQSTGGCLNLTPQNCAAAGGVSGGVGTNCSTYVCFPIGACCLPNGSCQSPVSPQQCSQMGGTFQGNGTTCAGVNCPLPTGACCFGTGFCLVLTQADCGTGGGTWHGAQSTCADANGNGNADVCEVAPPCPGDVDSDNDVDLTDLATLLANFGNTSGQSRSHGDMDADGDVDLTDLAVLLANFGNHC